MNNRKPLYVAAAAALALSGVAATNAQAHNLAGDMKPDRPVTLDVVAINGSGCPAGTAALAMAPDNQAFTVTYSDYIAEIGAGVPRRNFRKNCQLGIKVNVPNGFTYAVYKADYRGYAMLAEGASAQQKAGYYFQGDSSTIRTFASLKGEMDNDYTFTDEREKGDVVWSPCGKANIINVNTSLLLRRGSSGSEYSMITMDSSDYSVNTKFNLAWKKC